jgi:hypothetical protein
LRPTPTTLIGPSLSRAISASSNMSLHTAELVMALARVEDERVHFGVVVGLHLIEADAKVAGVIEVVEEAGEVANTVASKLQAH